MMPRFRSILSILLVLVTTLLVSCGSPQSAKIPTTYSPEKIAELQVFAAPIAEAREKMSTLKEFISEENWTDTRTFIHGPLGLLRQQMLGLSRSLLPKDQKRAVALSKELFGDFERIDTAAKERNAYQAQTQYREAVEDFDAFLNLVPKAS
jgi:photosystem II protein PsbQ